MIHNYFTLSSNNKILLNNILIMAHYSHDAIVDQLMLVHVYWQGIGLRPTLLALYKNNALQL